MGGSSVLLAMGQMLVKYGDAAHNLARAEWMIREAALRSCHIVVLPECLDAGWTHPEARMLGRSIPGEYSDRLCRAAEENGVYVAAGLTEVSGECVYNAAILISPAGDILLKHRKINELAIARDIYSIGDRLGVVRTPLGVIGVNICADNFPESLVLGHSLARMGAQIIVSPSAWAVEAEYDNERTPYGGLWLQSYEALSRAHGMAVVGVSSVGRIDAGVWQGRKCIGSSLAVGAGGKLLARAAYGEDAEDLVCVRIELPR